MDDINRNLSRLQLFPDYDTTPMSLEDINEMTTTKALMHAEAVLKELTKLCNLNTEDTNKIKEEWDNIVSKTNDGKKVIDELIELMNTAGIYECSTEDINNMFKNGSENPNPNLATNQDIDNMFNISTNQHIENNI